jgi:hypothetical protein
LAAFGKPKDAETDRLEGVRMHSLETVKARTEKASRAQH